MARRREIIDGTPYNMSLTPNRQHQGILSVLLRRIGNYLEGKPGEVYPAPFDVHLSDDYSQDVLIENVVQPDLSVFCDKNKLDDKGAVGAPDLVVEILSPSTSKKDMNEKMLLYQKFAVREYWVVDPEGKDVRIFVLDEKDRFALFRLFKTMKLLRANFSLDLKFLLRSYLLNNARKLPVFEATEYRSSTVFFPASPILSRSFSDVSSLSSVKNHSLSDAQRTPLTPLSMIS